ncbi:unnamed protein product [Caretta caretta]
MSSSVVSERQTPVPPQLALDPNLDSDPGQKHSSKHEEPHESEPGVSLVRCLTMYCAHRCVVLITMSLLGACAQGDLFPTGHQASP